MERSDIGPKRNRTCFRCGQRYFGGLYHHGCIVPMTKQKMPDYPNFSSKEKSQKENKNKEEKG
jgi:hypothetical protein